MKVKRNPPFRIVCHTDGGLRYRKLALLPHPPFSLNRWVSQPPPNLRIISGAFFLCCDKNEYKALLVFQLFLKSVQP